MKLKNLDCTMRSTPNQHSVIDILPMCSIILIQEIASLSSGVLRTRGLFIYEVPWQINHTKSIKNFSVLGIVRAKDGAYTYGTNDAYFKNSYIPFQPQISCP